MIIDKNGTIIIQNLGITITPEFTVDDLNSNPHFETFKYGGSNDDYTRYYLWNELIIGDLPFTANLYFYKNKISSIHMSCLTFKNLNEDFWSVINELTQKKHEELIIAQHGGTQKLYSWGVVYTSKDVKSGYAGIGIRYKNSHFNWKELIERWHNHPTNPLPYN
jgi:hypothetical protein